MVQDGVVSYEELDYSLKELAVDGQLKDPLHLLGGVAMDLVVGHVKDLVMEHVKDLVMGPVNDLAVGHLGLLESDGELQ